MSLVERVKPRVKLLRYIDETPRVIASAGKSTLSPRDINEIIGALDRENIVKWIVELVKRGHGSPLEHSIYIYEVICSRVASHQLVRHRIASYTQLSQRYSDKFLRSLVKRIGSKLGVEVADKPKGSSDYGFYSKIILDYLSTEPGFHELLDLAGEAFIIPPSIVKSRDTGFIHELFRGVAKYYELLVNSVRYEDARYVLPQAVKTRILVSMNARELLENFLPLRMCSHAQWEIRYIAWMLWRQLVDIHPEIFSYTGPRCILYDNRVRRNPCRLHDYLVDRCKPVIERCPELVPSDEIMYCLKRASHDPWL